MRFRISNVHFAVCIESCVIILNRASLFYVMTIEHKK